MKAPDLLAGLRTSQQIRRENQRHFPQFFTDCTCEKGCQLCGFTRKVSKATARQLDEEFALSADAVQMP